MYKTRKSTVFDGTFRSTEKRVKNTPRSGVFWLNSEVKENKYGLALSWVFDISSQSKLQLKRKQRNKIVKIFAN